ncbi:hypothetical protein F4604DRAFT_1691455 [Suillus subluteus]|nr:hypothetical protein F4604DRAFT_1691455 [Suillus subluteus]
MPSLNLQAKELKIASLLDELTRHHKHVYVKEKSRKEELLAEVIESVIYWLDDIWRGAAHMFQRPTLVFRIRRSSGKVVKSFHFTGARNLERVMLADGTKRQKFNILDMLDDIRAEFN